MIEACAIKISFSFDSYIMANMMTQRSLEYKFMNVLFNYI